MPFQFADRTRISLSFPHFSQLNSYIGMTKVYSRNRLFQGGEIIISRPEPAVAHFICVGFETRNEGQNLGLKCRFIGKFEDF